MESTTKEPNNVGRLAANMLGEAVNNMLENPRFSVGDADYIWKSILGDPVFPDDFPYEWVDGKWKATTDDIPTCPTFPIVMNSHASNSPVVTVVKRDGEWVELLTQVEMIRIVSGVEDDGSPIWLDTIAVHRKNPEDKTFHISNAFRRRHPDFTIDSQEQHDRIVELCRERNASVTDDPELGLEVWHADADNDDAALLEREMLGMGGLWVFAHSLLYAADCVQTGQDPLEHLEPEREYRYCRAEAIVAPDNIFHVKVVEGAKSLAVTAMQFLKGPEDQQQNFETLSNAVEKFQDGIISDVSEEAMRKPGFSFTRFSWKGRLVEGQLEFDIEIGDLADLPIPTEDVISQFSEDLESKAREVLDASIRDLTKEGYPDDGSSDTE